MVCQMLSPFEIYEKNIKLKNELFITNYYKNNKILHILIDIHLHPKNLICNYKIKSQEYEMILLEIKEIL